MKKLLLLFAFIVTSNAFGQETQDINLTVKDGNRYKAAANTEIIIPLTVDLYSYTHIAIVSAPSKGSYKGLAKNLIDSPLTIINPIEYDKKRFKKNRRFLKDIKNPKWLYLYFKSITIDGLDIHYTLVVRNSENRTLYQVKTINRPSVETLNQIINF
tara:strand:+ start:75 stop:545 length:471 start_codon:yes stop_codon:yes gene_type:complete